MIRAIKMQENISKLNDFCKKNLQKNVLKKRNATIQHPNNLSLRYNNNQKGEDNNKSQVNQSKISGRKINFEHHKRPEHIDEDSSRLSTEFYEEYYRLLNSLKKNGQQRVHDDSKILDDEVKGVNLGIIKSTHKDK